MSIEIHGNTLTVADETLHRPITIGAGVELVIENCTIRP